MYIPKMNALAEMDDILAFIDRFSFGILISTSSGRVIGTHIPMLANNDAEQLKLHTHIALANPQWKDIEGQEVLVIFTEPHAYISPTNYIKEESVPTWNYMAVHLYGHVSILHETDQIADVMRRTMVKYEPTYYEKWLELPTDFKQRMLKGIVTFEVAVTEVQGKAKLSQNKSQEEIHHIIQDLHASSLASDSLLAEYMERYARKEH
ncbi:FMN-binding negative transcriptional regulator [Sphingobacterium suaedae]|uniref:FMN-binding negative transcriptional regulator n=1 Tax=Sphingobacterium suaedae TaxID=1686402 RepID=A0ABW5KJ96_9SPHI